jgi:curli biogenesis system outer membrane secretion channel CsgG
MSRARPSLIPLFAALAVLGAAAPVQAQEDGLRQQRPTLMVAAFDTDRTTWMPPPRLGETLAELLTDRLVAANRFRVVDALRLESQHLSTAAPGQTLLDRATAAGLDYLIVGALTQLSIERRSTSRLGLLPVPLAGGLIRRQKTESLVGLTIRVIDVRTGEVVAAATAQSEASDQTRSGGGLTVVSKLPIVGGGKTSVMGIQDRLLNEAVAEAIEAAADEILAAVARFNAGV